MTATRPQAPRDLNAPELELVGWDPNVPELANEYYIHVHSADPKHAHSGGWYASSSLGTLEPFHHITVALNRASELEVMGYQVCVTHVQRSASTVYLTSPPADTPARS